MDKKGRADKYTYLQTPQRAVTGVSPLPFVRKSRRPVAYMALVCVYAYYTPKGSQFGNISKINEIFFEKFPARRQMLDFPSISRHKKIPITAVRR
jgi:hypothetical protein